jgi:5-methylcytosine-specific restriction endonuclease McrA
MKDYPALILNADYQPISYFPLSLWNWQDSIKAVFLNRVHIIAEYNSEVSSSSFSMKIPSVIALKKYIPISKKPPFTRFNLFLRDNFSCQYCGDFFNSKDLTFDHVIPKSKGGKTRWENVVAACSRCNLKKSNLLLSQVNMKIIKKPYQPTNHKLQFIGKKFPPNYLHKSWMDYLYWDSELEKN